MLCCGCKQHWEAFSSIQLQCRVWGSPVPGSGRGQAHTKLQRPSFGLNCCRLWSADGVSWLGWVAEACPRGHGLSVQGRRRGESTEAAGMGHPWPCSRPVSEKMCSVSLAVNFLFSFPSFSCFSLFVPLSLFLTPSFFPFLSVSQNTSSFRCCQKQRAKPAFLVLTAFLPPCISHRNTGCIIISALSLNIQIRERHSGSQR